MLANVAGINEFNFGGPEEILDHRIKLGNRGKIASLEGPQAIRITGATAAEGFLGSRTGKAAGLSQCQPE